MQTISQRLKEVRAILGITQKEMSQLLQVKPSYYSDLENGHRTITGKFIEKLNKALEVSADWMYTGKGSVASTNSKLFMYPKSVPSYAPPSVALESELGHLAEKKGWGGENKAVYTTYKLLEKLYDPSSKKLNTEELAALLLNETDKWEDKTINYYLRSFQEVSTERPELNEIKNIVENVIIDSENLQKISKTYFDGLLNSNIEFTDYESFKANRIANFEKLLVYKDILKPLVVALEKFVKDFTEFDKENVINED